MKYEHRNHQNKGRWKNLTKSLANQIVRTSSLEIISNGKVIGHIRKLEKNHDCEALVVYNDKLYLIDMDYKLSPSGPYRIVHHNGKRYTARHEVPNTFDDGVDVYYEKWWESYCILHKSAIVNQIFVVPSHDNAPIIRMMKNKIKKMENEV